MCKLEAPLLAPLEFGSPLLGSSSLPESLPPGIGEPNRLTLIRGGTVLSMDARVGNFAVGDVLLKGSRILEVAPKIEVSDAAVIDASGHIVMPGFIDTHHHHFETALRGLLADAILLNDGRPSSAMNYYEVMLLKLSRVYRPEDVYINILYGSIAQLDAGVTTAMDVSQIHHSPEHSDAAVAALRDAGRRAVLGYFEGWGEKSQYPQDAARIRSQHFSSNDQLLTMVMGGEIYLPGYEAAWRIGRELAIPIAAHIVGTFGMAPTFDSLSEQNQFGPDNIFIHMTGMSDMAWQRAADSGAHVSLSVPIEMHMRHGTPPLQKALDLGMTVSLSSDVECTMTADMFTQMRSTITLQRMFANQLALDGKDFPSLMSTAEVLQMATLNGARGLRLEAKTGSLTPGKEADIILLDTNCLNTAPLNHAPGAVVTLMERCNVSTVICGGKVRKWQGELLGFDLENLRRRLEQSRDYIFATAGVEKDLFR
ncbi:MAG: amidohydrolase family protein [Meiothermus sp.]|nr:amidohydrolase family protein [Meiothermus sp.]